MPNDIDAQPVVLINIFTVEPENQQRLIDLLTEAANEVRHAPGFISSTLHRSLDGAKVAMYARWTDAAAYQAMRAGSRSSRRLEEIGRIARFEPGIYAIVETFAPAG